MAGTHAGVEGMTVAVMGCVVNGPGESKAASIGISLPGTGEAPNCPVFIDGEHVTSLRGTYDELAIAFQQLIDDYVQRKYPRQAPLPTLQKLQAPRSVDHRGHRPEFPDCDPGPASCLLATMPVSVGRCSLVSALAVLLCGIAPGRAQAQGPAVLEINFKKAAEKVASSLETGGTTVRVGVIPITSGDPALVRLATDTTTQFLRALDAEPNWPPRDVRVIEEGSPTALIASTNRARAPIDVQEAVRAGQRASAAYVVVGNIVQSGAPVPDRVELQLIDVQSGRAVTTTTTRYASAESPAEHGSFWTSKTFALIAGLTATAFAVSQAWQANDELTAKKAELLAVPPGDLATFNQIHDQADALSRTRNWWWGVAVGVASVTTSFVALTKSSPAIAPFKPATDPISISTGSHWSIGINPAAGRLSLARSF